MKNVLIIGGGRRGKGLLEILLAHKNIKVVGVVDLKKNAAGIKFANSHDIPTYTEYESIFAEKEVDIVLDVSGDTTVLEKIEEIAKEKTEVLGGVLAQIFSDILLNRHEAQQLAFAQKKELESILEGLGEGVLVVDAKKRIILVNPAASKLLGIKDNRVLLSQHHGGIIEIVSRCLEKKERIAVEEIEFFRKIEEKKVGKWLQVIASRIEDEDEDLFAVAIIIRDITAEKEIDRIKSELISNVSHELRTPLTSINNAIYLIEKTGDPSPKARQFLITIQKNSDRLLRVINNLLDISKIESGMLQFDMDLVSLCEEIETSIFAVQTLADTKKIKIEKNIPDNLVDIYGSKEGLEHIFINLLANAIKFTQEGGRVSIIAKEKEEEIVVAFEDTGVGIPAEDVDRIFGKFQRAKTAGVIEGTGVGLAIVKHFVDLHKGKIWVESTVGKGTRFFVGIPKVDRFFHLSVQDELLSAKVDERLFSILLFRLVGIIDSPKKEVLLKEIEKKIREEVHRSDKVIRYEDKGFFIILLRTGREEAQRVAERLTSFVDESIFPSVTIEKKIFVSYGIATFPEDGENEESLIRRLGEEF
ncbi:MAG: ATP-binding protein [bacterium]|nr:ATP-binding protein [bacterium]